MMKLMNMMKGWGDLLGMAGGRWVGLGVSNSRFLLFLGFLRPSPCICSRRMYTALVRLHHTVTS